MAETAAERALRLSSEQAPFMNFVTFTSTLVSEIFRTLVDTSREQLEAYVGMVEAISGGPTQFIANNIGDLDVAALKYLNEVVRPTYTSDDDPYTMTGSGASAVFTPPDATLLTDQVQALTDSFAGVLADHDNDATTPVQALTITGTTVPLARLHAFARIMLEKAGRRSFDELQALLRMGLARVVPNKGFIETSLTFSIDTKETSESSSKTTTTNTNSQSGSFSLASEKSSSSGVLKKIFGDAVSSKLNIGANASASNTNVRVNVINEKSTAATNLDIDITGRVRIDFLTDYFPLLPPAPAVANT